MNVIHERPGVYSSFDASTVVDGSGGGKVVAAAARAKIGTVGEAVTVTGEAEAIERFGPADGEGCLTSLIRMALANGASAVVATAASVGAQEPTAEEYQAAFAVLEAVENIGVVVCGSTDVTVQQKLRDSVEAASAARRERVAVVGGAKGESVSQLVDRAEALNSERVVLAAPGGLTEAGAEGCSAVEAAAAVAGAIAGERDPAVPLGGAVLSGLSGLAVRYGDNDLDVLIRGGVTPLECVAGEVSVVRGVTTRTKTGEAADATWRELSTILIVDDVIPAVRNSLRTRFRRAKNTAQTRGAVRSQVILELENKKTAEIINGYDNVAVTVREDAPTVCLVEFGFSVASGLNQIHLTAHITV